jgi:hypothetical protein
MPSHQLLKSPPKKFSVVSSSSTIPSMESIYALVGKQSTSSSSSTYSPADVTAKRKEQVRIKLERDEEGLGTASAFSSGNLDSYGQGIIIGHSSGINLKARAKAFEEGRSSPRVERSPEVLLTKINTERQSYAQQPSIGILPGGGNSDYSSTTSGVTYSGTPASQKRHFNSYEDAQNALLTLNEREEKNKNDEEEQVSSGLSASNVYNHSINNNEARSFASPTISKRLITESPSQTEVITPVRISASKRAEEARREYIRELEAQAAEQRMRKEAEKAYRLSPGWTSPQNDPISIHSSSQSYSPSKGGIAELLGSSNGYFSIDSRSPSGSVSQKNQQQQPNQISPTTRPFLRLDPLLPESIGSNPIPSNEAWTPRSPQRQTSNGEGVHSYSPKWMAQRAAELEMEKVSENNKVHQTLVGRSAGVKSPGSTSGVNASAKERLLREQVNRLTEKFETTLDALQERYGPLEQ